MVWGAFRQKMFVIVSEYGEFQFAKHTFKEDLYIFMHLMLSNQKTFPNL